MKQDRKLLHLGINFILSPCPVISSQSCLSFQQSVLASGLEFTNTQNDENKIIISRQPPSPLEISVAAINPPHIGQFLIVAILPQRPLSLFCHEADAAAQAFQANWPHPAYQILGCDICIRELHEATSEHAFKEIWEDQLHQSVQALDAFDRPIIGGGLRFVTNPLPDEHPAFRYDIKIESFIEDTRKIFIEINLVHLEPFSPGDPFSPSIRIQQVENYLENQVYSFMKGVLIK